MQLQRKEARGKGSIGETGQSRAAVVVLRDAQQ